MGNSRTSLKFSITIDYYCKVSRPSLHSLLKNMSKIPMSDLNKKVFFANSTSYTKGRRFSMTSFDILVFFNILHLEMNFGNLH